MTALAIRPERPADGAAIWKVHVAAFSTDAEARLVDRLRAAGQATVSLVAERDGVVVGHIVFSPVTLFAADGDRQGLGLAPVAVLPEHQRQGIGSALIERGLAACRQTGCPFVTVLGHADYYPRFGFLPASQWGITNEYGVDDAFMARELQTGALAAANGLAKYCQEFHEWS